MSRKYKSRKPSPLLVELRIVLEKSGAYKVHGFSMLSLRKLNEYHSKVQSPRKWRLSLDEKRLILT